jgi:hypothetical protein
LRAEFSGSDNSLNGGWRGLMQTQYFFDDPAVDSVFKVVFSLAAELHINRCRVRALEKVLVSKGVIAEDSVECWQPNAQDAAGLADLDTLVGNLFAACKLSERQAA